MNFSERRELGVEQGTWVHQVGKGILDGGTSMNKGQEAGKSVVGFRGGGSSAVARAGLESDWIPP